MLLALAHLKPLPIGGIYPANNDDRAPVRLAEVPKQMAQALLATEDRNFYSHRGFDLRGIARANPRAQRDSALVRSLDFAPAPLRHRGFLIYGGSGL